MTQRTLNLSLLACVLLWAQHSWADTTSVLVDFNTPTDLERFNLTSISRPVDYFPSGGIGNTGSVRVNDQGVYPNASLVYNQRSFDMSDPANSLEFSVMFRYKAVTQLSNGGGVIQNLASLDLYSDPSPSVFTSSGIATQYNVTQYSTSGVITHSIWTYSFADGSGSAQGFTIPALSDGHWYHLATKFSFVDVAGARRNNFAVSLQDFGTNGNARVRTVFMQSIRASAAMTLFSDATSWVGFSTAFPKGTGADRIDNFQLPVQVPEPTTWTLIVIGVACWNLTGCKGSFRGGVLTKNSA